MSLYVITNSFNNEYDVRNTLLIFINSTCLCDAGRIPSAFECMKNPNKQTKSQKTHKLVVLLGKERVHQKQKRRN